MMVKMTMTDDCDFDDNCDDDNDDGKDYDDNKPLLMTQATFIDIFM